MEDAELFGQSIDAFLQAIASDAHVPGGGSVAAYTGAAGMGLVVMALEVSKKRADYTAPFDALIARGRGVIDGLKRGMTDDISAFSTYMDALKLPKETDAEKAARKAAMTAAAVTATEAPLAAARQCVDGLRVALEAKAICRATIMSDVLAGANLLDASCRSILLNVDANIGSIPGEEQREGYRAERAGLQTTSEDLLRKVLGDGA
jgi:formiminotetrahydrofolate cyclodeaminase